MTSKTIHEPPLNVFSWPFRVISWIVPAQGKDNTKPNSEHCAALEWFGIRLLLCDHYRLLNGFLITAGSGLTHDRGLLRFPSFRS